MKIYRLGQLQTQQGYQVDPGQMQAVMEAIQYLNMAVANINQSLQTMESAGTMQLFSRAGVIQAIQSGDLTGLNINEVNDSLNAMQQISQSALAINNALKVVRDNADAANLMKMDINILANMMVTSLQSGDFSAFTSTLGGYQSQLGAMTNTSAL